MNHFLNLKDPHYYKHSFAFYLWATLLAVFSVVALIFTLAAIWIPGPQDSATATACLLWVLAVVSGIIAALIAD